MTSTIKVNNIQNQCGTAYIQRCGTTITLGTSGDNITLACGATQTGFGRTGTVDWDTTAKTASFTAVSGTGYFVNTTSGAITVTLPTSPSAGDIVSLSDYASTWQTNNVTIASALINGSTGSTILSTKGQAITFVYVDGTRGWKAVQDNTDDISGATYITATGGTITTSGDYKIHTFTGPGTFTVCSVGNPAGSTTVDYLVVAGGGGGASVRGGGGGAGGFRESSGAASGCYTISPLGAGVSALPVSATSYPITVGGGGSGGTSTGCAGGIVNGTNGSNSVFSTITSSGGGVGAVPTGGAQNGGSGGGGSSTPHCGAGANGNTPSVNPPQGNNGGTGAGSPNFGAGGGGGATAVGINGTTSGCGGSGGAGATTSISGSPTAYSGGGGGSNYNAPAGQAGDGGIGGGGDAGGAGEGGGSLGTTNTGGGGGGGYHSSAPSPSVTESGGSGGSGIVIIRYKYQ